MKVLYIGRERHDAQAVAAAVRRSARGAVAWTSRPDSAATWIQENADVAAVVIGPDVDLTEWHPVLDRVRGLPSGVAVLVIRPENAAAGLDATAADDVLPYSASWSRDLADALGRALLHARTRGELTRAAEHRAQLQAAVELERRARAAVEEQLAEARAAARGAAEQLAKQQAQYEAAIARAAVTREMIDEQLRDAALAVAQSRRDLSAADANAERLGRRETELSARLAEASDHRIDLEQRLADREHRLADAGRALEDANARSRELEEALRLARQYVQVQVADLERRMARQAELERLIEAERRSRATLEQTVADRDADLARVRRERDAATGDVERLTRREAELVAQLSDAQTDRDGLERQLATTTAAMADAEARATIERAAAADDRADLERRLRDALDAGDALQRTLTETQSAARHIEASLSDEIATLRSRAVDQASAFETERRDHAAALAARDQQIEHLNAQIAAANLAFDDAERRLADVQRVADRVPELLAQLDASRGESERRFAHAPVGMFRCTRDGTLIDANAAWLALVRSRSEDLVGVNGSSAFMETPDDLGWLIGRCVTTRTHESIETAVRRHDGARLFVRLSAYLSGSDVIECVAEDLTPLRVFEDRLAQAARMEAAGRLASEVALSCTTLLTDVRHHCEQWLVHADDLGFRRRGETILDDLTRAERSLQQLVAYSTKQARTPATVDLQTVVRHLVPVLKRVAGPDVDVTVAGSSSLTVDVDSDRVERLLVSLAACGRERMPFGGQLTIEIGTSTVGRQFAARYPNVRPGPHALMTITEARRSAPINGVLQLRDAAPASRGTVDGTSTINVATLQALVGGCGGHLWMKVQPPGDIVAKIRLPLLVSYGEPHAPALAASGGRGGTIARWFRH